MVVSVSKGISQWSKDRKRGGHDRPHSGDRDGHHERRQSVGSIAASEASHGDKKVRDL